jgi:hypothetical protein
MYCLIVLPFFLQYLTNTKDLISSWSVTSHTLNEFNKLQATINFTIEKEQHKSINFLDLTIHQKNNNLQFSVYQKHTPTDIIRPSSSCHPYEHKLSGINYLLNRLHTYPVTEKPKDVEKNTIKTILHNNKYDINLIRKIPQKRQRQRQNIHDDSQH